MGATILYTGPDGSPRQGYYTSPPNRDPIAGVVVIACELHRYPCRHAFANETRPSFDPEVAELAWQRTLAFPSKHLG
ncbi:MAG: dienelactone hydrolase family protein [Gammaproteobacteria bacterium]